MLNLGKLSIMKEKGICTWRILVEISIVNLIPQIKSWDEEISMKTDKFVVHTSEERLHLVLNIIEMNHFPRFHNCLGFYFPRSFHLYANDWRKKKNKKKKKYKKQNNCIFMITKNYIVYYKVTFFFFKKQLIFRNIYKKYE